MKHGNITTHAGTANGIQRFYFWCFPDFRDRPSSCLGSLVPSILYTLWLGVHSSNLKVDTEVEDTRSQRIVPERLDLLSLHLSELVDHLLRSAAERSLVVEQVVCLSLVFRGVVSVDSVALGAIFSCRSARNIKTVFVPFLFCVYHCMREGEGATYTRLCDSGTPISSYTRCVTATSFGS